MKKFLFIVLAAFTFAASAQTVDTKAADTAGGLVAEFGTNAAYDAFMAKQKALDAEYLAAADEAAGLKVEFGTHEAYAKGMTAVPTKVAKQ